MKVRTGDYIEFKFKKIESYYKNTETGLFVPLMLLSNINKQYRVTMVIRECLQIRYENAYIWLQIKKCNKVEYKSVEMEINELQEVCTCDDYCGGCDYISKYDLLKLLEKRGVNLK